MEGEVTHAEYLVLVEIAACLHEGVWNGVGPQMPRWARRGENSPPLGQRRIWRCQSRRACIELVEDPEAPPGEGWCSQGRQELGDRLGV